MDSASDEINIILPLFLGIFVLLIFASGGLVYWLLIRFRIIEFSDKHFPLKILKGAFLSFVGAFALLIIINLLGFGIDTLINFFKK